MPIHASQAARFHFTSFIGVGAGCRSDLVRPLNGCGTVALPLSSGGNTPVVLDVGLEMQISEIVVVATANDPQGAQNLLDVLQGVSVIPDESCSGTPIVIRDDLVAAGVEETFGTIVETGASPALYEAIATAARWPVAVDFRDVDGNVTTGSWPA